MRMMFLVLLMEIFDLLTNAIFLFNRDINE